MIVALLLACAEPAAPPATPTALAVTPLPAPLLLRRLSLDLRGTLPTLAELDAVEADPDAVGALRDTMLVDARLQERLVDVLAEQYLTRADRFTTDAAQFGLDEADTYAFVASAGEEPLRLAAWIAASGQPWTEVARSEYTLANDLLLSIWPLEAAPEAGDADLSGWRPARYTDARPAGGVVMTNGFAWRYSQAVYSRSHAAAVSDLFLCHDYFERPVEFDAASLLAQGELQAATREVPVCVSCHASLDPLAAALLGFYWYEMYDPEEVSHYHPERETLGPYVLGTTPAWYGQPLPSTAALGDALAGDPRFVPCAVERFATGLWRRPVDADDHAVLAELQVAFEAADLAVPALLAALTETDEYRAGGLAADAPSALGDRVATRRLLTAPQLADVVEQLTGFRWVESGWDQLDNDVIGYRLMVGGASPPTSNVTERDHGLTRALVLKRLARDAAATVVEAELETDAPAPRLFTGVDLDTTPADDAFDAQVQILCRQVWAERCDEAERGDLAALWSAVAQADGPAAAWASVVAAMLRDTRFWSY